jgi:hypothetical protein
MAKVELSAADVEDLEQAAIRLAEHGEHVLAGRLEALARYARTVIKQTVKEGTP